MDSAHYINDKVWLENLDKLSQRFNAWVAKQTPEKQREGAMLRGAAASLHAAWVSVDSDAAGLRRALKKSRRREQLRAAALVLPLFVFLAACFVLPIGAMLSRGMIDADIARILPTVTAALKRWDGHDLPPESAYAALIADIRAAREGGTLASAATRLNYDVPGFRSLLFTTGR